MAVFKAPVEVVSASGVLLGRGMAYLHLPRGLERTQDGSGTVSLLSWTPSRETPAALRLPDGREVPIDVSRDALSDCSANRILRYRARWAP